MRRRGEPSGPADGWDPGELPPRPRTRGECLDGPRPCPWTSCRHHLYLDVNPSTGSLKINFPGMDVDQLRETCSLDVADAGENTLKEVGEILGLTRERIRQLEAKATVLVQAEMRRSWR